MSFFAAALLRPEIQTIAQEQLDVVTKRERIPTFEDRPRLPFIDATCKEVLRWRPVVPLGEYYEAILYAKDMMIHRHAPCNDRR
jgi:cytochrome P450